ncbi:hypothetical protein [Marinobacter mobilis]|uniref:Uncharacterized protein n=1 Tax=Marinobacter mobilis TaxID=488533 RepID=A0A1H3ECV5_9GAMM|nr:hypothetical protein [Marinobacter mobilis]SDX76437.1 hypothetical protein SAMN04487960_1232 [Marinobacter mobilis]
MINGKIISALVIHLIAFLAIYAEGYPDAFLIVVGSCLALNVIGLCLCLMGIVRFGCSLFIAGCIGFIPLGLVGILGARQALDAERRERFAQMEAARSYRFNPALLDVQIFGTAIVGLVWLILMLVFPFVPAIPLGGAVIGFLIGSWNSSTIPVKCYEDHIELKLSLIAPTHLIKYKNITDIDTSHRKHTIVSYALDGAEKSLKLKWNGLEDKASEELLGYIQGKWVA